MDGFLTQRVTVTLLLVWQTLLGPVAQAAHPLNPSGEGEVIVPSPFDTQFPFPIYIPREISQEVLDTVQRQPPVSGITDPAFQEQIRSLRQRVQEGLGVYPHLLIDTSGPGGQHIAKQVTFLKPFSDSFLSGDFFKGPKKYYLDQLQEEYRQVQTSASELLQAALHQGRLPDFGSFSDDLNTFHAAGGPVAFRNHLETYMNALIRAHRLIQTLLVLPTETVDPDLVLDMANAMGIGPQVWHNDLLPQSSRSETPFIPSRYGGESTEDLLKRTTQRFCTTSYLYRYIRGMALPKQSSFRDVSVDNFSAPYLMLEAMGDDLLGMTLADRKAAYAKEYAAFFPQDPLTQAELDQMVGMSVTWAEVPVYFRSSGSKAYRQAFELITVWIPLATTEQNTGVRRWPDPKTLFVPEKFAYYLREKASRPFQSQAPETALSTHRKSFLLSMGVPQAKADENQILDNLANVIRKNPLEYLRIKDQFLVMRGLYEGKGFGVLDEGTSEGLNRIFQNAYGVFSVGPDDPRLDIELIFPSAICESLYERNYVTQVLLTQTDVAQAPQAHHLLPGESPEILLDPTGMTHAPFFAQSWFHFWRSSELASRMMDAIPGQGDPDQNEMSYLTDIEQALQRNELRPWALYRKLYHGELKPQHNITYRDMTTYSAVPATLQDWILPNFFSRFARIGDFTYRLWTRGLSIAGNKQALRPGFNDYVRGFVNLTQRNRLQPYELTNYTVRDRDALPAQMLMGGDATQVDIAARERLDELMRLSGHLWRSRVLFTPQELYLIITTYFKEFLLPLALMQRFLDGHVLRQAGVARLKEFRMHAGTVQYELLYLLQNPTESLLFDLKPTVLAGGTLTPVLNAEDWVDTVSPAEAGYVISLGSLWDRQTEPLSTASEWSKHDRLMNTADQIERYLNKRVLWCKTLPERAFSSLAAQVGMPEAPGVVQDLVCAIPGYMHAARALGMLLTKEQLRFDALKDYFTVLLKRKNENKALLPFLSHIPEVASLGRHLQTPKDIALALEPEDQDQNQDQDSEEDRTSESGSSDQSPSPDQDYTLSDGINQYQELVEMLFAYQNKSGWFQRPHPVIRGLYDFEHAELRWEESVPATLHDVDVTSQDFTNECHYLGTAKNPIDHEKELYELKMLCLYHHVRVVREALATMVVPFQHAITQRWVSAVDDQSPAGIPRVAETFYNLSGDFDSAEGAKAKGCGPQSFALSPLYSQDTSGTFSGRVKNSMAHMVNILDAQHMGGFVQDVLEDACPGAQDAYPEISLEQLFLVWKQLAGRMAVSSTAHEFFGQDVLFTPPPFDPKMGNRGQLITDLSEFQKVVRVAHARSPYEERVPENQKLATELAGVYREVQFEHYLNSLVAIKTALNRGALHESHAPPGLRGQDPLSDIVSEVSASEYAREIRRVTEVETIDYTFIPWVGFSFSYNRQSSGGRALATVLDFIGLGHGGSEPGTTFKTEAETGGFAQFGTWVDKRLCAATIHTGGRLMPWISRDQSQSIPEAFSLDEDWHWRGWRATSFAVPGLTSHKTVVDPGYFCDLKYTFPTDKNIRPLSARERMLIDQANDFLSEARKLRQSGEELEKQEQARYEIESEFLQAVLVRVFIDKLTTQVLIPYQEALQDLQTLVLNLQERLKRPENFVAQGQCLNSTPGIDPPEIGCVILRELGSFYRGQGPYTHRHFQNFLYLKQLFFSLQEDLFPSGALPSTSEQLENLKNKLFVAFGSLGHLLSAHRDQGLTPENITQEGVKYSLLAHIHQTIAEIEAFNAEIGGRIITHYPVLDREAEMRADGSRWAVVANVPRWYQLLFATSVFDGYRTQMTQAQTKTKEANAALSNAMPQDNDFYDSYQDAIDTALQNLLKTYPFSPSDLLTHALVSQGKHYGKKKFSTSFLGNRTRLPPVLGENWDRLESYETDRTTMLQHVAQDLFPWLGPHTADTESTRAHVDSLSHYFENLQSGQEAQLGQESVFLRYQQEGAATLDFRPESRTRSEFSRWFDRLLALQLQDTQVGMERILRTIHTGEFEMASEKTLVELFSNDTMIESIRSRFGDRFVELEYEYVPSRIYSYMEQEQGYMNIMADFGNMMMASMLMLAFVVAADRLFGTHGWLGGAVKYASGFFPKRLASAAAFSLRFALMVGVGTTLGTAGFSWLTGGQVSFMPVLILAMLMSVVKMPASALAKRWFSKSTQQLLTTALRDVFMGFIVMDIVGAMMDWEVSNYTSLAYAQASSLFYGYMRMGRVYQTLYGPPKKVYHLGGSTWERTYEPLIQDYQYFAYLKQTKTQNFSFAVLGTLLAGSMNTFLGVKLGKRQFHKTRWGVRGQVDELKQSFRGQSATEVADVALANERLMDSIGKLREKLSLVFGNRSPETFTLEQRSLQEALDELHALHTHLKDFGDVTPAQVKTYGSRVRELLSQIHAHLAAVSPEAAPGLRSALEAYQDVIAEMLAIRNLVRSEDYQVLRRRHFERRLSDHDVRGRARQAGDLDVTEGQRAEAAAGVMEGDLSFDHFLRNVQPYYFARHYEYVEWLGTISETFRWPFRQIRWRLQDLQEVVAQSAQLILPNRRAVRRLEQALARLALVTGAEGEADLFAAYRKQPRSYVMFLIQNRVAIPRAAEFLESHPNWKGRQVTRASMAQLQADLEAIRVQLPDGTHQSLEAFLRSHPNSVEIMRLAGYDADIIFRQFSTPKLTDVVERQHQGRLGEQLIRLVDEEVASGRLRPMERTAFFAAVDGELAHSGVFEELPWHIEGRLSADRIAHLSRLFDQHSQILQTLINAVSVSVVRSGGKIEDVILMRLKILDAIERLNGRAYFSGPVVTQLFTHEDLYLMGIYQQRMGSSPRPLADQMQELLMDSERQQLLRERADAMGFDMLFSRVRDVSAGVLEGFSAIRRGEIDWSEMGPFVTRSRTLSPKRFEDLRHHPFFADEKGPVDTGLK